MPISGSEKHGASMLNCRFSEKAEHIPIKKRRFVLRSPSPPPLISSEFAEETASLAKSHDALDNISPGESTSFDNNLSKAIDNSSKTHDEKSKTPNNSFGGDEDFSGISILAAAACSSSLRRESGYAEDGMGLEESSAQGRALEVSAVTEAPSSSRGLESRYADDITGLQESLTQGQALEVSAVTEAPSSSRGLLKEDLVNSSEVSTGGTSSCVSTEPVRELPSISTTVNSPPKFISKVFSLKVDSLVSSGDVSCSKDKETVGIQKTCSQDDRLHWDLNVVMDAWELPYESPKEYNDVPHAVSQDARKHTHHDIAECLAGRDLADKQGKGSLEENKVNHSVGFCHDVTHPICFDEKSLLSDYNRKLDVVKYTGEDSKSMCYNTAMKSTAELVFSDPATYPDVSGTMNKGDDDDVSVHSLKSNGDGHQKVGVTLGGSNLSASGSYSTLENLRSACAYKEIQPSLTISSCRDTQRHLTPNLAVIGNMKTCQELQYNVTTVDFDSQYEDGEVRDPNEHLWDGYDGVDREAECMNYKFNDMEVCTPIDYYDPESGYVEDRENCGPGVSAVNSSSAGNVDHGFSGESTKLIGDNGPIEQDNQVILNYASEEKMEASGSKELLKRRSTSSDMDIALSDDNGGKEGSASHPETHVESKPVRRGVQSRNEGPVAHDTSSQEERLNKVEFRYEESSSIRPFERPRVPFHNQGRGQRTDSWSSFRGNYNRGGFRRHYSPNVHRHVRTDDDATMERDDVGYASVQDDGSYTHQLHSRNRSGADEDEYSGLHSRYKPNRAFSPGRPSTFGRGRGRGRGRYNGPSRDESFQSSLNYRRPLSCRQRSFSPFGGRGQLNGHHSRGRSPSQSRSRSPTMWNSPRGQRGGGRGRGAFVRLRSRSPNCRSEVRMQRLRPGHHLPDFEHDDSVGFRPYPRSHRSPPHGRWSSGKEKKGNFGEFGYKQKTSGLEGSPVRIRMRGDRARDSPRNLKPEGYYRTLEDAACREPRCAENFEGRKYKGPLRPARRSYDDGMTGRLNQANDDSFSIANDIRGREASYFQSRGKGMDNRISDLPRRFRGEQHPFMCERDGKFNSTPKQFGVDNMMDSSRNLKSDQHYQSSCGGRFSDVNGLNRVRRYDNFEDRRRHYDPPDLMKRNDTEGSEKRSNHNLDENFQDNSDFRGRGMRSFNGRAGDPSTRLREDKDSLVCGQENKLEDSPQ